MFLSSRWGKPAYEIDQLPVSEFIEQKVFWDKYKWGMESDMLAMIMSQVLAIRTGKAPSKNPWLWKELSVMNCGKVLLQKMQDSGSKIRRAFMGIVQATGAKRE